MSLHSITGLMSSGKTAIQTYWLYLAYCKGKSIITNYDLCFPHRKINQDWLLSMVDRNEVIENVAFGLDELWMWLMDSRNSQGKESRVASYFFLQSSKDDSEIYLTAQDNTQNDSRLRNNLHYVTECNRSLYLFGRYYDINSETRFLEKKYGDEINDLLYIKARTFNRKLFFGRPVLKFKNELLVPAKPLFALYNTKQKIKPRSTEMVTYKNENKPKI